MLRTTVLCSTTLIFGAAAASAEDKTLDLSTPDRFQVGDVMTHEMEAREESHVKVLGADGATLTAQDADDRRAYRYVQQCLAADAAGKMTKSVVYIESWSRMTNNVTDDCLKGLRVEVAGLGAARKWKLVGSKITPSTYGKLWLDLKFGGRADEAGLDQALLPRKPIRVGDRWDVDPAFVAIALGSSLPFDVARLKAEGTFLELSPAGAGSPKAKLRLEITAPWKGLPTTPAPGAPTLPWTEGGTMTSVSERSVTLEGRVRSWGETSKTDLSGKADAGGSTVEMTSKGTAKESHAVGGKIPDAPTK